VLRFRDSLDWNTGGRHGQGWRAHDAHTETSHDAVQPRSGESDSIIGAPRRRPREVRSFRVSIPQT
jgi:hypothetical protein